MDYDNRFEMVKYTEVNEIAFAISEFTCQLSHIHHDMELDLVLEGEFLVRTNDELYEAGPGSILAFNPCKPHEFIGSKGRCRVLTVYFRKKFCDRYFPVFRQLFFVYSRVLPDADEEMQGRLRQYLFHLGYNYYLEELGFELRCYSDLNAVVYLLIRLMPYRIYDSSDAAASDQYDARFQRIIRYIEENYRERLTLGEIARKEQLSPSYLSHFIKNRLNMSFQEYVNILRFEYAVQLLVQTDKKLVDICMESGFSESKYFNKIFARSYAMSPAQFRKLARGSWGKAVPDQERGSRVYLDKEACLGILRQYFRFPCDEEEKSPRPITGF